MHVVRPYLGLGSSMAGHGRTYDGTAPDRLGEAEARARRADLGLRYRDLLDHLPAAVYVEELDGEDRIIDVSAGITDLLGIDPHEWVMATSAWIDAVHPDDRERVLEANEAADRTGEPFHVEYRARHRDGREVWIRDDAVLVRDDDGRTYWLGVMLDVTALASARQDLQHAQHRYGALVEQIPAIVYVDVADEHMTSTYVSPQIREILGVEPRSTRTIRSCGPSCCTPRTARRRSRPTCAAGRRANPSRSSTGWSRATAASCGSATPRSCCPMPRAAPP